ncbi:MAG: bacteriophage holin [Candidatus Omnitrophota bacterium]
MAKIDLKALALSLGIFWGGSMIFFAITAAAMGFCADIVDFMSTKYIGYAPTVPGAIIGGIFGFIDAGICGLIIGWLYNKFSK